MGVAGAHVASAGATAGVLISGKLMHFAAVSLPRLDGSVATCGRISQAAKEGTSYRQLPPRGERLIQPLPRNVITITTNNLK